MIGMVTRMTAQRVSTFWPRPRRDHGARLQLVMLSSGDPALERLFLDAERRYPNQLRVILASMTRWRIGFRPRRISS